MIARTYKKLLVSCALLAAACGSQAQGAPWWSYFHDASLNLLQTMARDGGKDDPQREARVTRAYVQARLYTLRMNTAQVQENAAAREAEMLLQAGQDASDAVIQAQARAADAASRGAALRERRDASLIALADELNATRNATALANVLGPALEDLKLPMPATEMPQAVPAIARSRGNEKLVRLAAVTRAAEQQNALVHRLTRDFQTLSARYGQDPAHQLELIAAAQALLAEEDRLLDAGGAMVLAWIDWQQEAAK